jgi:hypothetical protein
MPESLDGDFLQTYLELAPHEQTLIAEQALHESETQDAFKTTNLVTPTELRLILSHLKS